MPRNPYIIGCVSCCGITSKAYAKRTDGRCKACFTGEPTGLSKCPDCGEKTLSAYQKRNHYHCDGCTRDTDPEGYRREVLGLDDYGDY